jgi:hypothetical protein
MRRHRRSNINQVHHVASEQLAQRVGLRGKHNLRHF